MFKKPGILLFICVFLHAALIRAQEETPPVEDSPVITDQKDSLEVEDDASLQEITDSSTDSLNQVGQSTDTVQSAQQKSGEVIKIPKNTLGPILGNFSLTVGTGYGRTFYKHDVPGFAVVNSDDRLFIFGLDSFNLGSLNSGYGNWINQPGIDSVNVNANDPIFSSDTTEAQFTGGGNSIPLEVILNYHQGKFKFGAGVAIELHNIGSFTPSVDEENLGKLDLEESSTLFKRYFINLGYEFYRYWYYRVSGELRLGKTNLGNGFDENVSSSIYTNVGINIERAFSEIFGVFARPSYEYKTFTTDLGATTIKHNQPGVYITFGIRLSYPKLPKCPIPACHIQIDHKHWGREFRSRRHPFFKWQDPDYGENFPELIKYKGRNKKKRNPY